MKLITAKCVTVFNLSEGVYNFSTFIPHVVSRIVKKIKNEMGNEKIKRDSIRMNMDPREETRT